MAIDREKVLGAAQKLASKRQFDKAIIEYRKILQEQPNDDRTLMRIADLQVRMAAHEAAVATLLQLATYYGTQGFTAKAIAVYQQARTLVQQHLSTRAEQFAPLLPKLAQLYKNQGLLGDAALVFDEYATILEKAGRSRDALEAVRQLASLRSDDPRVRMRLVDALMASGDTEGAMAELRTVANQHIASGRRDEAIQVYERMLAHLADPVVSLAVAELYLDRGAPGDGVIALNRLQICFQSTQRDPATLRVLARALEAAGQRARATDTRKLLLKTLLDASNLGASRDVVSKLLVEAPGDDNVRQAAIKLGLIHTPPEARPNRVATPVAQKPGPATREPLRIRAVTDQALDRTRRGGVLPPPLSPEVPGTGESPPARSEGLTSGPLSHDSLQGEGPAVAEPTVPFRRAGKKATAPPPEPAVASRHARKKPTAPPPEPVAASRVNTAIAPQLASPPPPSRRGARKVVAAPPEPTTPRRLDGLRESPAALESTTQRGRYEMIGLRAAPEPTPPRRRDEPLGSPAAPRRRDALEGSTPAATVPEPTMPFRREVVEEIESAASAPEPTMPFRREVLEEIESAATAPEPTMPFRREVLEEIESAATAPEPTMPFRREALEEIESAATAPEPTMPFRREALEEIESAASAPEPTMPFRREILAEIESASTEPEPTMPFRREALEEIESAATAPEPTMPFLRAAIDALEEVATQPAGPDEEPGEETVRPEAADSAPDEESVVEVLAEVAFYESQNLLEDALALVEEQLPSFPNNQPLIATYQRLRDALGPTRP